jgi:uncharacterized damage-inducible protein DinB
VIKGREIDSDMLPNVITDVQPLEGYQEPYGLLCAILQDGTREWRGELDAEIGPDAVTWRPRPGGQSIGAIMLHIIAVEVSWIERFGLDRTIDDDEKRLLLWDEIDVDEGRWPDPPNEPLSWYFELHDRLRVRTLEAIKSFPPAETLKDSRHGQLSMRWVLGHVIQHESYHGGQIVTLHDLWKNR